MRPHELRSLNGKPIIKEQATDFEIEGKKVRLLLDLRGLNLTKAIPVKILILKEAQKNEENTPASELDPPNTL